MKNTNAQKLLVLVPHRDIRLIMRRYSEILFKEGFTGAFAFPWVVPLAYLSSPMNAQELKSFARDLKETTETPKFTAKEAAKNDMLLFGVKLEKEIPAFIFKNSQKITKIITPALIGACLLEQDSDITALPCPPQVSFGAAAVANMSWEPLETGNGYKWKIGNLYWLPNKLTNQVLNHGM
jgi:hypothetical protein